MYFNRRNLYYQGYPYFSPFGFLQQQERSYAQAALAAQAKLQAYRLSQLSQLQQQQEEQQQQQQEIEVEQQIQQDAGNDGVSFVRATGGPTTAQGDFTPYGYVSRPGSTPLSYSLWGSNASTTSSEESYRRQFSQTLCRVVFGCAVLLVILAVLGIVGIAVYLGVLTNEEEGAEYEVWYRGQMKVSAGDTWIPDLARSTSPAFKAKALKYEKMLEAVYDNSILQGSLRKAKVVHIARNPENSRGLGLKFRLALDRRKMPSHVDNTEMAVKDVLLQELMSLEPVAFHNVAIDIDSVNIARDGEASNAATAASTSSRDEEDVQVIKVTGTQESPGGSIVVKRPSGGVDRSSQEDRKEESSTVANLIYQFGEWRPVNPYVIIPSQTPPTVTSPAPKPNPSRSPIRPYVRPSTTTRRPSVPPETRIFVTVPQRTTKKTTTAETTTTTSTTRTTPSTTITTTTTTEPPTTTTTTTTTRSTTTQRPTTTTSSMQFNNRFGIAVENPGNKMTTKRNPSRADLQAILADLMFFTTPRPRPHSPSRVPDIPHSSRPTSAPRPPSTEATPHRTLHPTEQLITFHDILETNDRRPAFIGSRPSSDSNRGTTAQSFQTPDVPQFTSYTGVREPLPPRPSGDFKFPLDRFRYPSTSSAATTPTTNEPPPQKFNIWDFLTTRKPLILNTEVVTSTSVDVQYGATPGDRGTTQFGPVYRPTSELAPVYIPNIEYGPVYRPDKGTTDQFGPVFEPTREPPPLKEFSGDNYVTVPVISGSNVRYITVNKTRANYPKVVIVNLQTTPEVETTTPLTSSRGDGRRFNTKFLEDIFKTVFRNTNYRGVDGATHFSQSTFSNRQGKPISLDVSDSPAPLLDDETNQSLSLWALLRNLSQMYLSDPAIIQQLQDFERAAVESLKSQESTSQPTTQGQRETTPPLTPFFQHLRDSQSQFLKNSNVVPNQQTPGYSYIPLHGEEQKTSESSADGSNTDGSQRDHTSESVTPWPSAGFSQPMDSSPHPFRLNSLPFTTLFMTGVEGKSSGSPQVISVSSRSPAISSSSSSTTNSPIHTFVLKEGQSMEELLQEIFDTISLEEENETIPSPSTPDHEVETTTEDIETTYQTTHEAENKASVLEAINKILQKHLEKMTNSSKHSQEQTSTTEPTTFPETTPLFPGTTKKPERLDPIHDLFPVMTRPMNFFRPTTSPPYEILDDGDNEIRTTIVGEGMTSTEEVRTETSVDVSYSIHSATTEVALVKNDTARACQSKSQFRCKSGECIAQFSRCNLIQDCRDNSDENECSCADFLKSKFLNRKICDGIVDCWDHSDESNCEWCKPGQFICPGSSQCIEQSQVCDGITDCEDGDDERTCVTIAPDLPAANSLDYHGEGFLMVRKQGVWGKLCLDNFEQVTSRASAPWTVSDLGQAVCKTLTFSNFSRVERHPDTALVKRSRPSSSSRHPSSLPTASPPAVYYEINVSDEGFAPTRARSVPSDVTLSLDFEKTSCPKKDVVRVSCDGLQCGMRPRAIHHRARIVGGSNSGPGSWPWHAALYKEGEYQCGATLINNQWLISAGHCFYSATNNHWVARLGALRRGSKFPSPYEQLRKITHIFIHPEYVDTGFINDITLLRVDEPVRFTDYVRPVCLPPPGSTIQDGRLCTLVGWGQLFEVGRIFPDTLQEVEVPLISTGECRKRTVFIPLYRITDDMFCAGYDRGGRDACLGDSGGPLMCQEPNGSWQLVGVTSNGYGCARPHRPGVYTKVVKYLDWMNQVMELTKSELVVPVPSKCEGHRCPLGQCLGASSVCNGVVECSDGSDEAQCH